MNKMNRRKIISEIEKRREELKARGVKKLGLFGSYLKGKQKKGSDVDLLITLEKIDTDSYLGTWVYLEKIFKRKIDLVIERDLIKRLAYVKKEAEYVRL